MSLTARDLNAALWAAADEMRLVMSADVYKDYLLGLVFTRLSPTRSLSKPMSCSTMKSRKALRSLRKPMKRLGQILKFGLI